MSSPHLTQGSSTMHDQPNPSALASAANTLPHITGLVIMITVAVALGQPVGWIGYLAAAGPLLGHGLASRTKGANPQWREAQAFGLVAALLIGGGWTLLVLPSVSEIFVFVFPVALLAFLLGLVNYVTVSISRAYRAYNQVPLNYPWIPDRLARLVGLRKTGDADGHR